MNHHSNRYFSLAILIGTSFVLSGCSSSETPNKETTSPTQTTTSQAVDINSLSSGNMLHILRDAADIQLKTGKYIESLRVSQNELQQALETQDQTALKQSVDKLKQQLTQLDERLKSFNLKSQEVEAVRRELAQFNQQALHLPVFDPKFDLSKANFEDLQEQLTNIQSDIVQLATMAIPHESKDDSQAPADQE